MPAGPYYLDTSALLKRYLREDGSQNVDELFNHCRNGGVLCTSYYTCLEVGSCAERLHNSGAINNREKSALITNYYIDAESFLWLVPVDHDAIDAAMPYIRKYSLRSADSLHLSSFVQCGGGGKVLVSADKKLNEAARAKGLHCLDPAALSESEWEKALED